MHEHVSAVFQELEAFDFDGMYFGFVNINQDI